VQEAVETLQILEQPAELNYVLKPAVPEPAGDPL
jgi:hypothetical protein